MVLSVQPHDAAVGHRRQPRPADQPAAALTNLVLVGNPNVGKSAIFNALTGMNADVSNYPGTTIDVSRGKLGDKNIVDTPGIYGVSSFNDEERIARKIIVDAELVINVVSALSLDRDLFLTTQLIAMGMPMLVVINQWDEALARGMKIDVERLSTLLGVPVITTIATKRQGVDAIALNLGRARPGLVPAELAETIAEYSSNSSCLQPLLLLALEGDEVSAEAIGAAVPNLRNQIYKTRREQVNQLFDQCVTQSSLKHSFATKLGRALVQPIFGSIVASLVCYAIFYQLLGVFVAGNLVDLTEKKLMRVYYEPAIKRLCANVFPCSVQVGAQTFEFPNGTISGATTARGLDSALAANQTVRPVYDFWKFHSVSAIAGNILVGDYGVLTLTVTYLLALLMPLVLAFYLSLSLLEDSGYLPRLAVLVDRVLNKFGLNGRAIIPLILGLGCVTMATVTTRLLATRREKIIASALLGIAIPCSAQLGIVSGTLAKCGGFLPWLIYGGIVGGMLAATGVLLNMAMPGKSQALMIDLPPMRLPRWENVLKKTWTKSWNFLQESIPMFALAGLVVSLGQMTGFLDAFIRVMSPITVSLLHLPDDPRVATTFALGIVRRDFAAFGLTDVTMTATQAVVAMIVITLFVPCIATVGVMIKERGMKIAMTIWAGSWVCAFVVGGLLARVLPSIMQLAGR